MTGTLSPPALQIERPRPLAPPSYHNPISASCSRHSSKTTTKKSAPPECARSTLPCGARAARILRCIYLCRQIITITHERVTTNYNTTTRSVTVTCCTVTVLYGITARQGSVSRSPAPSRSSSGRKPRRRWRRSSRRSPLSHRGRMGSPAPRRRSRRRHQRVRTKRQSPGFRAGEAGRGSGDGSPAAAGP
jgi:hypothetical protein